MTLLETFEFLSYVVTVIGLPFAIIVFIMEQRKERDNEEEEIYQRLSDEYREFLKLVLDNADLQLLRQEGVRHELTEEQKERRLAIFGILISLFERAYLLVYEEDMDKKARRLWQSWEDYMIEWVRRAEFRDALPNLLEGEDEEFTRYIRMLAEKRRWNTSPSQSPERSRPSDAKAEPLVSHAASCLSKSAETKPRNTRPVRCPHQRLFCILNSGFSNSSTHHSIRSFGSTSGNSSSLPAADTTS